MTLQLKRNEQVEELLAQNHLYNELSGIFLALVLGAIADISSPAVKVTSRNMLDSNNSNNDRHLLYFPKYQVPPHFLDRRVFLLRLNYCKSFCHSYKK